MPADLQIYTCVVDDQRLKYNVYTYISTNYALCCIVLTSDDHETNEYDRLLAMHLAQDLHQEDSLDNIVRSFGKPQSPVYPGVQNRYGRNSLSEGGVVLCFICNKMVHKIYNS